MKPEVLVGAPVRGGQFVDGRAARDDADRKVALLIAELKDIAHEEGVEVSVLFHCVGAQGERYFSTSFVDVLAENNGA
jgi:hypothetical protein